MVRGARRHWHCHLYYNRQCESIDANGCTRWWRSGPQSRGATSGGTHPTDGAHDAVTSDSTARRRIPVSTMSAHPDAPDCEPSPATGERERERRYRRRHSYSLTDDSSPEVRCRHRIRLSLHNFDGSSSFESFYAQFHNCASYNWWNDADKLTHLKASLTGDAQQILWDTDAAGTDTIEKMTTLLRNRYSGSRQSDKYQTELRLRRRRPGESLSSLHQDITLAGTHFRPTEGSRLSWPGWLGEILR